MGVKFNEITREIEEKKQYVVRHNFSSRALMVKLFEIQHDH